MATYGILVGIIFIALILYPACAIPSSASASLSMNADEEASTQADSIASGIHLVQYWSDITINNLDDTSNTTLGNIIVDSDAENIASVDYTDQPEVSVLWNQTHANWRFPPETVIRNGQILSTWWKTGYYYSQNIPMSMKRSINQTVFFSDGYQRVQFNVTFENKTCDYIWAVIQAEKSPLEFVDTTVLNETFTTDAPIKSYSTTDDPRHHFTFYIDPALVELGKPYEFSVVVRVNVTTGDGSPVQYTPRCAIGLGTSRGSGSIGTGYTVNMPSSALPPHAHSLSVTTNASNSWYYSNGFMQKMSFEEISRKLRKTEIGVYKDGAWYLDNDGSGTWNTGDKSYNFGSPGWTPIVGDWNATGKSSIGVTNGQQWYLDWNGNGAWDGADKAYSFGASGWIPVTGDWNHDGKTDIGVTNGQQWYLDTNGNGAWDNGVDYAYSFGAPGWTPIVGDWNGTGFSYIGVTNGQQWYLDWNGNGAWDSTDKAYSFGAPGWTPVTGDWNHDGKTDIGVTNGQQWYLDLNNNGAWDGTDKAYSFGAPGWKPVVGDWNVDGRTKIGVTNSQQWYLDSNGNGAWDNGVDYAYSFGAPGWTPVVGKWS